MKRRNRSRRSWLPSCWVTGLPCRPSWRWSRDGGSSTNPLPSPSRYPRPLGKGWLTRTAEKRPPSGYSAQLQVNLTYTSLIGCVYTYTIVAVLPCPLTLYYSPYIEQPIFSDLIGLSSIGHNRIKNDSVYLPTFFNSQKQYCETWCPLLPLL